MLSFDGGLHAVAVGNSSSTTLREAQRVSQVPAHLISESKSESISISHPFATETGSGVGGRRITSQMTRTNLTKP